MSHRYCWHFPLPLQEVPGAGSAREVQRLQEEVAEVARENGALQQEVARLTEEARGGRVSDLSVSLPNLKNRSKGE